MLQFIYEKRYLVSAKASYFIVLRLPIKQYIKTTHLKCKCFMPVCIEHRLLFSSYFVHDFSLFILICRRDFALSHIQSDSLEVQCQEWSICQGLPFCLSRYWSFFLFLPFCILWTPLPWPSLPEEELKLPALVLPKAFMLKSDWYTR